LVARFVRDEEAAGSNPVTPTTNGQVRSLVGPRDGLEGPWIRAKLRAYNGLALASAAQTITHSQLFEVRSRRDSVTWTATAGPTASSRALMGT